MFPKRSFVAHFTTQHSLSPKYCIANIAVLCYLPPFYYFNKPSNVFSCSVRAHPIRCEFHKAVFVREFESRLVIYPVRCSVWGGSDSSHDNVQHKQNNYKDIGGRAL